MTNLPKTVVQWLRTIKQTCTVATLQNYTAVIRQMCALCGDPKDWTNQTVTDYLSWCQEQGNSARTRHTKLQIVRSFIRTAQLSIQAPTHIPYFLGNPVAATDEEVEVLAANSEGKQLLAVLLMADAGLREVEVREAKWNDIENGCIQVRGKGTKIRLAPIATERLSQAIESQKPTPTNGQYAVPGRKGKVSKGSVSRWVATLSATQGLRHLTAHSLRHRFASRAARQGIPSVAIQHALGHSSLLTTEGYLRSLRGDDKFLKESFETF